MGVQFEPKTPFEGYIFGKLEDHTQKLNDIDKKLGEVNGQVKTNTKAIANMKGIAAGIGATFGLAVALVKEALWGK